MIKASLAAVGNIILKQRSDFDSRTYGYAKLSDLLAATTLFELDRRSPGDGKPAVMYARDKRRRPDKKPKATSPSPRVDTDSTSMNPAKSPRPAMVTAPDVADQDRRTDDAMNVPIDQVDPTWPAGAGS